MTCIIGIDVGGTNTDAVVVQNREVLASFKATTTKDVTTGVLKAVHGVLLKLKPQNLKIQQINLGTTHFVNSIVQRSLELAKVGVIRIATRPNTDSVPAFFDFPEDLGERLNGGYTIVAGGCEFNGSDIADVDESEIVRAVEKFVKNDVKNLVLISTFAPVRSDHEEKVFEIVQKHFGSPISCSLSHKIGQLGFIERENASILNETLKPICQKTLTSLKSALEKLHLSCPLFISQNDGTIVRSELAIENPVFTFASGPTNSMRGAAFISGVKEAVVVDIGGTSTDVGVLIKGFPRLTGAHVHVGGIRTNFRMPDTHSIGLGGGSRVRRHEDGSITIGPDSVGYRLEKEAISFGGQTLTTTDISAYFGHLETPVKPSLDSELAQKSLEKIQAMVEETIDTMKTSSKPIPVVLVGGGSILIPRDVKLSGSSQTIRPKNFEVANAIGSALCQVSGRIDVMKTIDPSDPMASEKALEELKTCAIEEAVQNGAIRETIELVDVDFIPTSYLPGNVVRIKVVAVGGLDVNEDFGRDLDWGQFPASLDLEDETEPENKAYTSPYEHKSSVRMSEKSSEVHKKDGIWQVSEEDVEKISIGAAILGCGGGGNPFLGKLRVLDQLNHGKKIEVISLEKLLSFDMTKFTPYVIPVGYMGAPAVQTERIHSKIEVSTALQALRLYTEGHLASHEFETDTSGVEFLRLSGLLSLEAHLKPFIGVIPVEIGGINSTEPLAIAAELGCYCLDADLMGRAFPELQMMTSYIYGQPCVPFAMASWKGEVVIVRKVNDPKHLEDFARKICIEFGCSAGTAENPIHVEKLREYVIQDSMTRCLNLGQAVLDARRLKISPIDKILASEQGRVLCSGKVTFVDRRTVGGFNRGYFVLEDLEDGSKKKVDFQNENLVVWDGDKPIAMVPDLIVVLETETGESIITDDMRYGLRATIVVLKPPELLTTPRALEVIGPEAFGYSGLKYEPLIK